MSLVGDHTNRVFSEFSDQQRSSSIQFQHHIDLGPLFDDGSGPTQFPSSYTLRVLSGRASGTFYRFTPPVMSVVSLAHGRVDGGLCSLVTVSQRPPK